MGQLLLEVTSSSKTSPTTVSPDDGDLFRERDPGQVSNDMDDAGAQYVAIGRFLVVLSPPPYHTARRGGGRLLNFCEPRDNLPD
jgi:hypothetical protein